MATWHEHTLLTYVNVLHTYCASRSFQLIFLSFGTYFARLLFCLTMLFFYFYNWKLRYHLRVTLVLLPVSFCFLFGQSSHHLKNIFTLVEVSFVILHEFRWRRTIHSLLHPQELVATK
jgi:hypothetical protein